MTMSRTSRRVFTNMAASTALLILSISANAQEVAYLDLTGVTPRAEVRHPMASERECRVQRMCEFFKDEVIGGDVASGDRRALRTTLMWMDKLEYHDGDRAECEVMIENIGEVPVDIPWTPHLGDLQPADDRSSFDASTFGVSIELTWSTGESSQIGAFILFGSPAHAGTVLPLKPGESARLRGRITLSLLSYKGAKLPPLGDSGGAIANSWLRLVRYSPQHGGLVVKERNIYPHRYSGDPLNVRIVPK